MGHQLRNKLFVQNWADLVVSQWERCQKSQLPRSISTSQGSQSVASYYLHLCLGHLCPPFLSFLSYPPSLSFLSCPLGQLCPSLSAGTQVRAISFLSDCLENIRVILNQFIAVLSGTRVAPGITYKVHPEVRFKTGLTSRRCGTPRHGPGEDTAFIPSKAHLCPPPTTWAWGRGAPQAHNPSRCLLQQPARRQKSSWWSDVTQILLHGFAQITFTL